MTRFIALLTDAGLALSLLVALAYLVRMALAMVFPIAWFWGGALACLGAPVAFAAVKKLLDAPIRRGADA
ncbi:MAG: hypothetical protein H0X36_10685 [Sphingomonadaceae bacterium]|nr:hypothetical protein [Sphingomonadaceae bacterium]